MVSAFHRAIREARKLIVEDGLQGDPNCLAIRIGVDPKALSLAAIDPGYTSAAVLARLDTFIVNNQPRILELNAESPAGMAYSDVLGTLFFRDKMMSKVPQPTFMPTSESAARAILETCTSWRLHAGLPPKKRMVVAIVDFMNVPTRPEFLLFRNKFEQLNSDCILADPSELHFDGDRLRYNGVAIDVVYRRLLVKDVLEKPEVCKPLLDAYRAKAICIVNSFRTALLHSKGLLALFHQPAFLLRLPLKVQQSIQRHIPWTGLLRKPNDEPENIREHLIKEKEKWVIKPISGHGGEGVVIGAKTTNVDWLRAIENCNDHVAQRFIAPHSEQFPIAEPGYPLKSMRVSLDPFLVRGQLSGFLCRLTDGQLGNVAEGAGMVPVFIADQTNPIRHQS